jgi:hypothetical protein
LPEVASCREWSAEDEGPSVYFEGPHVSTTRAAELNPEGLALNLRAQRDEARVRRPARVQVVATGQTELSHLLPYLRAMRQVFPEGVTFHAASPVEPWQSHTLGTFERTPRLCPLTLTWDSAGRSLTTLRTLQDLAREAGAAPRAPWSLE